MHTKQTHLPRPDPRSHWRASKHVFCAWTSGPNKTVHQNFIDNCLIVDKGANGKLTYSTQAQRHISAHANLPFLCCCVVYD